MSITASMVKELRDVTGAGMMDSKAALVETNGDIEAAIDWLRAKGLSKAAKKSDRIAAEGVVAVATSGTIAVAVEVNSETDFVARNDKFQAMVKHVADVALASNGDLAATLAATYPGTSLSVESQIKELVGTIGEHMNLRRVEALSVSDGVVATYVHNSVAEGMGKIGVLVGLESTGDKEKLNELGRQIAMHVAATNPVAAVQSEVDPALVERERQVFTEQAKESGKPDNIIEKMVEGRIRKFYEEVVLVSQSFVIDPDKTVEEAIKASEASVGAPIKLVGFKRVALGDGIEKVATDFAAEVAAAVSGS